MYLTNSAKCADAQRQIFRLLGLVSWQALAAAFLPCGGHGTLLPLSNLQIDF